MVTQSHLRERLKDRLQELVHELRSAPEAMPQEYISEVLGEDMNALYRILDFPTKQNFIKYLFLAGLADLDDCDCHLKTRSFNSYILKNLTDVNFYRVSLDCAKINILSISGNDESRSTYSRQVQQRLCQDRQMQLDFKQSDAWSSLVQHFEELYSSGKPKKRGRERFSTPKVVRTRNRKKNTHYSTPPDHRERTSPLRAAIEIDKAAPTTMTTPLNTSDDNGVNEFLSAQFSAMKVSGDRVSNPQIAPQQLFGDSLSSVELPYLTLLSI